MKNRFQVGDRLELMTPQGNLSFRLERMLNKKGEAAQVAPGNGHIVYLPVPAEVELDLALLMRHLDGASTRG